MIRNSPFATLIAILLLTASGCTRHTENAIRFGGILSLTGAAASYGEDNQRGIRLAEEIINASGGINGKKIAVDIQDDAGDPVQAITIARRYVDDPEVLAIVGPTRTGSTVSLAKLLPQMNIGMMSVGSTGDWQSAVGEFNDWTFRSTRVDTPLIEPLLRVARDDFGVHRIAAIYTADDDWSTSVMPVYEKAAHDLNLEFLAKESQMTNDTDRSAQLTKIKEANPDALIINTLASSAPLIADQARRLGIKARFIGTAGFANPSTWSLAQSGTLDGTLVAENYFPGSSRSAVKVFIDQYKKKFSSDPPPYSAYAYDGVMLLAEAARHVEGTLDRKTLRTALGKIRNYDGVLGTLTYNGKGDAEKPAIILQIKNNSYVLLHEAVNANATGQR